MNKRNITVEQMSRANALIQKLVADCERVWSGKRNGYTSFDTYDLIDKIYEIIHGEKKEAVKKFADELKTKVLDKTYINKDFNINISDIYKMIEETLKEYEK